MQSLIRCLIVDDTLLDRIAVEQECLKFGFFEIIDICDSTTKAEKHIEYADVIFLDIDMPQEGGLDFLQRIQTAIVCVFITSHPEYALEGFEAQAFDFLVKPLRSERFASTALRLQEYFTIKRKAQEYETELEDEFITIKEGYNTYKIRINEIVYLEALKDYTKIITPQKTYLTLSNLKNFLEFLSSEDFIRIHRSYAVAKNKVSALVDNQIKVGNFLLPIGKTFKKKIASLL